MLHASLGQHHSVQHVARIGVEAAVDWIVGADGRTGRPVESLPVGEMIIVVLPVSQVGRQGVLWPTELAHVAGLETLLGLLLGLDVVALAVTPAGASGAGHDQLPVLVALLAERTLLEGVAGTTGGVVLEPAAVDAGSVGPAVLADAAPLALPGTVRYLVQWRVRAIDVVGDVAVVAQDQVGLVVLLPASLADRAVQTAPALLEDDLGDLDVDTVGVVALAALSTADQAALQVIAQRASH